MSSIEQRSIKRSMNPSQGSDDRTTARESLMLWSLNLVLKATVRGARDSRVTLLIGLCWHQARPTSTKAAVAHFSPPGPAGPGVHKHFHPLRAGPPGRMITLMDVAVLKFPVGARRSRPPAGDQLPHPSFDAESCGSAPDFGRCS